MPTSGGLKIGTVTQIAPGATVPKTWNNAHAEAYCLNAWPEILPGGAGSAEITKVSYVKHGNPLERELHYWVKNTGSTTINVDIWAFWWNS